MDQNGRKRFIQGELSDPSFDGREMGIGSVSSSTNDCKPSQWWLVLLLAPFIGVLWVPFFNRVDPQIWGIPFFFWYQFLWVVISALVTALVYFRATPQPKPVG